MKDKEELHQDFCANLKRSMPAVIAVAGHLCVTGNDVMIPALQIAPHEGQWKQFSDHGDLYVRTYGEKKWDRWEVKHRPKWIDAPSFRYPDVYIERAVRLERLQVMPVTWVIVSADLRWGMIVHWENHESWWKAPPPGPGKANRDPLEDMWWCEAENLAIVDLRAALDHTLDKP